VSSFCDLALALVCSSRHPGASESEALSFNASVLARELERLLPICPNPGLLEPLLILMSSVKPAGTSAGTEAAHALACAGEQAQGSVLAQELMRVFETLRLRPDEARTRLWRNRCLRTLRSVASASCAQGLGSDADEEELSSTAVAEDVLRALDRALSRMLQTGHIHSGAPANSSELGVIVAAVARAYEERTTNRWLWARVLGRYDCPVPR